VTTSPDGEADLFSRTFLLDRHYKIKIYDAAMTHQDWKLMRKIFNKNTYSPGQRITKQNDVGSKIFQIESGQCRVYLDGSENKTLRVLRKGDMFGEINFLEQARTTANVEPITPTTVYEIERDLLPIVFASDPGLAGRFYHYLAKISSSLLQDIRADVHL